MLPSGLTLTTPVTALLNLGATGSTSPTNLATVTAPVIGTFSVPAGGSVQLTFAADVGDQHAEQAVFDRRQMDGLAVALHAPRREVDRHAAEREHRTARFGRLLMAPHRDPHPRHQFADAEGLGEVVVGAGVERGDLVGLTDAGREYDHSDLSDQCAQVTEVRSRPSPSGRPRSSTTRSGLRVPASIRPLFDGIRFEGVAVRRIPAQ